MNYNYGYFLKPRKVGAFNPANLANTYFYSDPTIQSSVNTKVAADFVAANLEYLSSASTDFDKGDEDFSYGCWFKFESGSSPFIMGKNGGAGQVSYETLYLSGSNQIRITFASDGTTATSYTNTDVLTIGTWYFQICVYDSVNDLLKTSINAAAFQTAAHVGGAFAGTTADLEFGARFGGTSNFLDGQVDAPFFYDKALSLAEVTALYNSGSGLPYADLTDTQKVSLVSWWQLNELSGNRSDSHGTNTLTDNNTVGYAQGKVQEIVNAGEPVYRLGDLAPTLNDGTQPVLINEPIWNTTHITYATNDFINIDAVLTDIATSTQGTLSCWIKPVTATPASTERIFSFAYSGGAGDYIIIDYRTDGSVVFLCSVAGTLKWSLKTDGVAFTSGVWSHITVAQNAVSPVIYINNVAVPQTFTTSLDKTSWFNVIPLLNNGRVGSLKFNSSSDGSFFNGDIQQIYISTDVKDAATRTKLYENNQP